jgi:hypothetical protein
MKKRVQTELDSLELIMKEKASMDSLKLIMDSLSLICDSSCEVRRAKFEQLTNEVIFYTGNFVPSTYISVTKTKIGALAIKKVRGDTKGIAGTLELNIEEWHNFIKALSECRINEWKRSYYNKKASNISPWTLIIISSNRDTLEIKGSHAYPPNWKKFIRVMSDIEEKIKKENGIKKLEK